MKPRGILFKNIAAILMLIALISLLLPFCKITAPEKTVNVSGYDLVKTGIRTGLEYHENGHIEDDYVIHGDLTWGDLKAGINLAMDNQNLREAEGIAFLCTLPILFCMLAMLLAFLAFGKKSMLLPTLFIALAFFENIVLITGFQGIQNKIFSDMGNEGIQLTLLLGIYTFTILCGLACLILMILWITGSFNLPESEDDKSTKEKKNKKERGTKRERRSKGRRKKKKSSRRKKKRGGKDEKTNEAKENGNDKRQDSQEECQEPAKATGCMTGESGIYQGTDINLAEQENGMFTFEVGSVPADRMNININKSSAGNFVIQFQKAAKEYTVTSHANETILLKTGDGKLLFLTNGESQIVGTGTVLQIGNTDNRMKLH